MKYYIGVTNKDWYKYLSSISPEDVNFWQPGGQTAFRVLQEGEPFLFKLKSPINKVAGIGFYVNQIQLPLSVAWDVFEDKNGFEEIDEFRKIIMGIRNDFINRDPQIGCIGLTNPIFFEEEDWLEPPPNFAGSIVQGKSYDSKDNALGEGYWDRVQLLLQSYIDVRKDERNSLIEQVPESPIYGNPVLSKVRIGQSSFKISVLGAYSKRCSISGERTLPVLEAAHIKPYSEAGPNFTRNGLLLRSDIHKLFDSGYITLTNEHFVEVSNKIKEEFENGKEYYQYHGRPLSVMPDKVSDKPYSEYIEWHNANVYKG